MRVGSSLGGRNLEVVRSRLEVCMVVSYTRDKVRVTQCGQLRQEPLSPMVPQIKPRNYPEKIPLSPWGRVQF